jgi:hypothetical protein
MPEAPAGDANPLRQAWAAAKANLLPAVFLWSVAVTVIVAYYHHAPTRRFLDSVSAFKSGYGPAFSFVFSGVSTAIIGGLWPLAFQRVARLCGMRSVHISPWRHLPFFALFWAYRGVEIDGLYHLQALVFGEHPGTLGLACKVLIDQGVYVTLWAIPSMVIAYLWKDCGYSVGVTVRSVGPRWYPRRCVPILVANWVVWIPAVVVIYSLPLGLQLPVMNINLCLFVLLVMFLTHDTGEIEPAP